MLNVSKGCMVATAVISFILTSTGCKPTPEPTASQVVPSPDDSALLSGVPDHIANPLRNCGNNLDAGDPSILTPCLKQAVEITFKDGYPNATRPEGYSIVYLRGSGRIGVGTGKDQVFLVVVKEGDQWVVTNFDSDPAYSVLLKWPADKETTIVVTTWDPADPYNQSVNLRGQPVRFAWSKVIPQVIKQ